MVNSYVPERGDIVWIDFDPQMGKEQSGHRPAIVLSEKRYNQITGLSIVCPITSKEKGYPFELKIESPKISGVILADHVKNLDWNSRNIKFITKAPKDIIDEVIYLINTIIDKPNH